MQKGMFPTYARLFVVGARMLARSRAVALLLLALAALAAQAVPSLVGTDDTTIVGTEHPDAVGSECLSTDEDCEQPCARIDQGRSRVWLEGQNKHFSYTIKMSQWIPHTKLTIQWPSNSHVTIKDIFSARVLHANDHELALETDVANDNGGTVAIVGGGSLSLRPSITCVSPPSEPPSPPGANQCELGARYVTTHTWDGIAGRGENAEIVFDRWEDDRDIRVTFPQAEIQLVYIANALIDSRKLVGALGAADTVFHLDTFFTEDQHKAQIKKISLTLDKPHERPVQIFCTSEHPPLPPPRPDPPSPPPLPMPPPPPAIATAMPSCPLGGKATVLHSLAEHGVTMLQIEVVPNFWDADYVIIIAISGSSLDVTRTVCEGGEGGA